jgi:uncharacterized membrane protein YbaN (DUF454 family)
MEFGVHQQPEFLSKILFSNKYATKMVNFWRQNKGLTQIVSRRRSSIVYFQKRFYFYSVFFAQQINFNLKVVLNLNFRYKI